MFINGIEVLLTERQLREKAIQHTIASTFSNDSQAQLEILIAAMARVVRADHRGRPLSKNQAAKFAERLSDALTANDIYGDCHDGKDV